MVAELLKIVKSLEGSSNVTSLDMAALASSAEPYGRPTTSGGLSFYSNVRNRNASQSVVFGSDKVREKNLTPIQQAIVEKVDSTLAAVQEYIKKAPLICVKRTIGQNDTFNPKCTLFLSVQRQDNVRQAHIWANTLRDYAAEAPGPDLYLVCIPEWPEQERQVLVFPGSGITVVLGIDYVGEVKMGFLRQAMWRAKQERMLSLHSGSKVLMARGKDGQVKRYGMLLFGLSGTGKSTHSCHNHGLDGDGEGISILQDDIVFLREDGSALGTEQGFFLKTEGIRPENQPLIYDGLLAPGALFENVMLDYQGNVDFGDLSLGGNGRAVIPRTALGPDIPSDIDMPSLDNLDGLIIAFVTRRMTVLPIVSKLNAEQAAATFMLGESIETSAGDPARAGESVRVVGTNPFVIGDKADEGNWFYNFLKRHGDKVQCYLLNTGGTGEIRERDADGHPVIKQQTLRVEIPEMASIIRSIARNSVQWNSEPNFSTLVPDKIDGLDMDKFQLDKFYTSEQTNQYARTLKQERKEWLAGFEGLQKEIVQALS